MAIKISFVALWLVYIAVRVPFDKIYRSTLKVRTEKTSAERAILAILALGILVLPMIWILTPWFDAWNFQLPESIGWIGVFLAASSVIFFRTVHKSLGANWSPTLEIMDRHELISHGVYRRIRHPMYVQMSIWALAQMLMIPNWLAGLSGIVATAIFIAVRIPNEERLMIEAFGARYTEYCQRTGRLLPKMR